MTAVAPGTSRPPAAPAQPPRPAGPKSPQVVPLDPNSPEGRQVADDLSRVLAEIELQIRERVELERAA